MYLGTTRHVSNHHGLPSVTGTRSRENSRRRSHPKRITLKHRGQSLSSTMRRWLWKLREERVVEESRLEERGTRRSTRRMWWRRGRTKKTKKKQPSEISEMTDTRFHPVEVTTMFVSRRYAGTQATFPSRFPVKLMATTSWGPVGWLRAHGTLKTAHLLRTGPRVLAGLLRKGNGAVKREGREKKLWNRNERGLKKASLVGASSAARRSGDEGPGVGKERRNKRRGKTDARG